MALFQIQRYRGDEISDKVSSKSADKTAENSSILKANEITRKRKFTQDDDNETQSVNADLIKEKKQKKKKVQEDSSHTNEFFAEQELSNEKKSNDKIDSALDSNDTEDPANNSVIDVKKKFKKKKKSLDKSISDVPLAVIDSEEDNDSSIKVDTSLIAGNGQIESSGKLKKNKKKKSLVEEEIKAQPVEEEEQLTNGKKRRKPRTKKGETDEEKEAEEAVQFADDLVENEIKEEEQEEDNTDAVAEKSSSGFQILGSFRRQKIKKVHRVLPEWLAKPRVISGDVKMATKEIKELESCLDERLIKLLVENEVTHLFPVQAEIIPELLRNSSRVAGYQHSCDGYRPQDICCSSPTGSGKTLAFVLPIIQILQTRVTRTVRCLVVEPVSDLAIQVHRIFKQYSAGTDLKIGLLTGIQTFAREQASIIKRGIFGLESRVDIIVCTPGRLVDHINRTEGFDLSHLRFLVIDEADRVMDEVKQDWLSHVEKSVYNSHHSAGELVKNGSTPSSLIRTLPPPLTAKNYARPMIPLQKLLFSATLSHNPEKLDQLKLFQPILFTTVVNNKTHEKVANSEQKPAENHQEDTADNSFEAEEIKQEIKTEEGENIKTEAEYAGKYLTPVGLKERFIECTTSNKPLVLLYLLREMKLNQVLCFTNSVDSTHRLCLMLNHVGGIIAREFSSSLHVIRRARILRQLSAGKINVLVCSDAMARGMDVDNVEAVVSYDLPPYIKTYVHRIGRTARAGRTGMAVSLLEKKEIHHFKQMLHSAGKTDIKELKVKRSQLKPFTEPIEKALKRLPEILEAEKKSAR